MAVLVTTVIAITIIWMGDLNFVAPIITMFFLNTYGMINLVAGIEKLVGNPSFRPTFKIPWAVSMLGAVGCYGAMFLINTPATVNARPACRRFMGSPPGAGRSREHRWWR